jgi:dolichol-phosphate mannosyltransferase
MAYSVFFYTVIGGASAIVNLLVFLTLYHADFSLNYAAPTAFILAAAVNYSLSVAVLFRRKARWNSIVEILVLLLVIGRVGFIDLLTTRFLLFAGVTAVERNRWHPS